MPYPVQKTGGGFTNSVVAPNLPQHARGQQVTFEVSFFEDEPDNTVPSIPIDASTYPAWVVVDPDGNEVANGVAAAGTQVGRWQFNFPIAVDAALSTQSNKWRVLWTLRSQTNRESQKETQFDVIELSVPDTPEDELSYNYIERAGKPTTLILPHPRQAESVEVELYRAPLTSPENYSTTAAFSGSKSGGTVVEHEEQNLFKYTFNTGDLETGEYIVMWTVRETATSLPNTSTQRLVVPPIQFWSLNVQLRQLIDKLHKSMGTAHYYSDGDIFDYLSKGMGIMNGVVPISNWSWCAFPWSEVTRMYLLEAAAIWALQAQQLLEIDLHFSFSGQTVTLDVDRSSMLEGVIAKLYEDVKGAGKDSWPNVKRNMMRQARPMAHVGVRAMGRRFNQQVVYTFDRGRVGGGGSANDILDLMTRLGLL